MGVLVVTPPTDMLVDLALAKAHLRVEGADEDTLIANIIKAVGTMLDGPDGDYGRAFRKQRLEARLPDFPQIAAELPCPPLADEDSVEVKYFDKDNVLRTLDDAVFYVASPGDASYLFLAPGKVWPVTFCRPDAVRIQFDAGYAAIPERVKRAVLLMIGDSYAQRETFTDGAPTKVPMSTSVENLLAAYWRPKIV
jgi:uncharacterized phiE125 gp8 family phage protein